MRANDVFFFPSFALFLFCCFLNCEHKFRDNVLLFIFFLNCYLLYLLCSILPPALVSFYFFYFFILFLFFHSTHSAYPLSCYSPVLQFWKKEEKKTSERQWGRGREHLTSDNNNTAEQILRGKRSEDGYGDGVENISGRLYLSRRTALA